MNLNFSFATDDGIKLKKDDHFGNAKYFKIYQYDGEKWKFIEQRENAKIKEDESKMHGDPEKAKAVSSVLKNVDILVGKIFGPNIKRILKKFPCIVIRNVEDIGISLNLIKTLF